MYKIGHKKKIIIKLKNDTPGLDPSKDKYMCDEKVQKRYDSNLREYHYDSDSSDENSDRYNDTFPEQDNDDVECTHEHNQMEKENNPPPQNKLSCQIKYIYCFSLEHTFTYTLL